MNVVGLAFFLVCATGLIVVPRRWAPVPLLLACCYMTVGQGVDIGPFSLPVYRMILATGVLRVVARREWLAGSFNTIDKLMVAWASWVMFASLFHEWEPGSGPVYAAGYVFNVALVYFLIRIWCRNVAEVVGIARIVACILVPVALEMHQENITGRNMFSVLGGLDEVFRRGGVYRAQGPFGHAIIAGTVGAVCFPLMVGIWRKHYVIASVGMCACVSMIVTSASSGPVMSFGFGVMALLAWPWPGVVRIARVGFVVAYLALELVMSRPAYYLISKIDITGSSTGWHRSRLIESTIEHFGEWWLFGTDRTVHWMDPSAAISYRHADITNYYIWSGVIGGFAAMILIIAMMWCVFLWVGRIVDKPDGEGFAAPEKFMVWCFGAGMFAHATTSLSVSYFDQSVVFFWLNVAIVSSMYSIVTAPAIVSRQVLHTHSNEGESVVSSGRPKVNPAWKHAGAQPVSRVGAGA